MRSAYLVLGVPGDASPEEIETAFHKAERLFPRERLAEEDGALARLGELKAAYQVLRDPGARAAHDRKLQQAVQPPLRPRIVIVEPDEASPMRRILMAAIWLLCLMLAIGGFMSWRNAEARKEQAAHEIAQRQAAEQAATRQREEQERQAALRIQQAAQSQANDQAMAYEARNSLARATADMRAQEANAAYARRAELADAQRQEAARQNEDRRAAAESRMRVERDKQRVREVCIQVYRRPDC